MGHARPGSHAGILPVPDESDPSPSKPARAEPPAVAGGAFGLGVGVWVGVDLGVAFAVAVALHAARDCCKMQEQHQTQPKNSPPATVADTVDIVRLERRL